jgi:hypothetical protein
MGMMSVEECRKILQRSGGKYNESDAKSIRDFLYSLAEIEFILLDGKGHSKQKNQKIAA